MMHKVLQPLTLLASRRQPILSTASPMLLPARHLDIRAPDSSYQRAISGDKTGPSLKEIGEEEVEVVGGKESSKDVQEFTQDTLLPMEAEPVLIKTKYGIRLEIAGEEQVRLSMSDTLPRSSGN